MTSLGLEQTVRLSSVEVSLSLHIGSDLDCNVHDVVASYIWKRKVGGIRYEARSRGRSSPDSLAF